METPFENEMPQKNIVLQKESDPMDSIENPGLSEYMGIGDWGLWMGACGIRSE